jgi:hypothetical protein
MRRCKKKKKFRYISKPYDFFVSFLLQCFIRLSTQKGFANAFLDKFDHHSSYVSSFVTTGITAEKVGKNRMMLRQTTTIP